MKTGRALLIPAPALMDTEEKGRSPMPTPDVITQSKEHADFAELAALALYRSVRPVGGLEWLDLTEGQRDRYRDLITEARAETDLSKGWPQDDTRERWATDYQARNKS